MTYVLDPILAKLNNATLANPNGVNAHGGRSGADIDGRGVVCHSYSYVATFASLGGMTGEAWALTCATQLDGLQGEGVLHDADGGPVNTTCFVLVDKIVLHDSSLGQA